MKEQLETIPVNEAFETEDECPFCYMEREVEQKTIRYVVGPAATYMEPEVRAATARVGFCAHHIKSLYDYGNHLGAALILQTYTASVLEELKQMAQTPQNPPKKSLFGKKPDREETPYWERLAARKHSCYICGKVDYNMARRFYTFFVLLKEPEFREKVLACKGFCMRHFGQLLQQAEEHLPNSQRQWFYETVYELMCRDMERVKGDLDWFVAKFDHRNASAPWNNSRDALPRTMQKIQGLYPSDPPYKEK